MKKGICVLLTSIIVAGSLSQAYADVTYKVERGDTLSKIARRYGVTVDEIVNANGIKNPDLIFPEENFVIPVDENVSEKKETQVSSSSSISQEGSSHDQNTEDEEVKAFINAIDSEFAENVINKISSLGDNPDVGNRSSGSEAEKKAAEFIAETFREIGLKNVTTDEFTCDTWQFNKGRIYYTDENGNENYIVLGGYATHLVAAMEKVEIVYAGRGTAEELEGLDVEGKLVLIDINQHDDWWINIPAYQAHVKGAKAVVAVNVDGYAQYDDDTIGVQDICGPANAPAFAISKNGADILKGIIERSGGSAEVVLDAESIIGFDGKGQNVWGEIEGKTEEVIYFFAHMDGYFHSYFDDATGVGTIAGIAKALVDSGYKPDKTIRFVAHGSEEWGRSDAEYDWSVGAYNQITNVHPEWAETAFAIINVDGFYPVEGEKNFTLNTAYELNEFASNSLFETAEGSGYNFTVNSPATNYTEDFSYSKAGIPTIVAGGGSSGAGSYSASAYHSSADSRDLLGFNEDMFILTHKIFGKMAIELDRFAVRPVDFAATFEAMRESYAGSDIDFDAIISESTMLSLKIEEMNREYSEAVEAENTEKASEIREAGIALDLQLHEIYKNIQKEFARFDWAGELVFAHEVFQNNIAAIEGAIEALESGSAAMAVDEYLYNVDYNWYAYDFDRETFDYCTAKVRDKAVGTWGEGMLDKPNEDLFDVIKSLLDKYDDENADLSSELEQLKKAKENQENYLSEIALKEKAAIDSLEKMIGTLVE